MTSPDEQADGLDLGADGFIVRPFDKREFVARVKAMLRIKAVEYELMKQRERFRIIVTSSEDSIISANKEGTVGYANPAAQSMFDLESKFHKTTTLQEIIVLFKSGSDDPVDIPFHDIYNNAKSFKSGDDVFLKVNDGKKIPVVISIIPVVDPSGEIINIIVRIMDISDALKLEHEKIQREKLETVQTMIATLNHEMNQPLSVMMSLTSMLKNDDTVGGNLKDDISLIYDETVKIADLIRKISELQKFETAKYSENTNIINLKPE